MAMRIPAASTVGFVGLGTMGLGLALNLAKRQRSGCVFGFDIGYSADMIAVLEAQAGITWVGDARELATKVDVLFTSLPGPREVDQVPYLASVLHTHFQLLQLQRSSKLQHFLGDSVFCRCIAVFPVRASLLVL